MTLAVAYLELPTDYWPVFNCPQLAGFGCPPRYNCSHAAVICTSTYTPLARQLAERSNVQLIDGAAYASMVNQFSEPPAKTFASQWIPRGKALLAEAGMLAVAAVLFLMHVAAPLHFNASEPNGTSATAVQRASFRSVVEAFYEDINAKRYYDAYSLLSPSFQAEQSYNNFMRGYATTVSVTATVTPTSDSTASVELEARDSSPSGIVVSHYVGTWQGAIDSQGTWRLDNTGMKRT